MRFTVFGASGGIGGELVRQAAAAGHDVTAVVRRGRRVQNRPDGVQLFEVDRIDEPDTLAEAVAGRDAVLSALGPRRRRDAGIAAPLTGILLDTMDRTGVRRILTVSATPVADPHPDDTFLSRRVLYPLLDRILRPVYDDLRNMEDELARSGHEWTSVRPPRLVNRAVTGRYRTAIDTNLPRGSKISRADVAHAMLAMVEDAGTFRHAVSVAW